jgi:hypothetical protein
MCVLRVRVGGGQGEKHKLDSRSLIYKYHIPSVLDIQIPTHLASTYLYISVSSMLFTY